MTHIDILNRRFGDRLGRPNGHDARFAWKFAPEVFYEFRPHGSSNFQRQCWADRIGPKWMLCQWRPTEISREAWLQSFQGRFPYPDGGEYKPHPETALPEGMLPTDELTAGYIASLLAQMEQAEMALKDNFAGRKDETTIRCEMEAQAAVDAKSREFEEQVADWEPWSWKLNEPHMPGDHDGPVSFGGI